MFGLELLVIPVLLICELIKILAFIALKTTIKIGSIITFLQSKIKN